MNSNGRQPQNISSGLYQEPLITSFSNLKLISGDQPKVATISSGRRPQTKIGIPQQVCNVECGLSFAEEAMLTKKVLQTILLVLIFKAGVFLNFCQTPNPVQNLELS